MNKLNQTARITLKRGLLTASIIALLIGWSMFSIISEFKDVATLKARNHEVISALSRLEISLTSAEKNERGYVIGGDAAIAPYQEAVQEVRQTTALIHALSSNDQFQQTNAERLDELIAAKLATLQFLVDLRKGGSAKAALRHMSIEQDKFETDNIKHVLVEMETWENTLLDQALKGRDAAYGKLWRTLTVIILFLFAGAMWHTLRVRKIMQNAEASEAHIQHLADHDALTGLPNRRLLQNRLDSQIADAGGAHRQMAVMFMDLDGFKKVNDTIGHQAGDELLKCVAQRLQTAIRASDTVARIGGDEFIILLPELNGPDTAAKIAKTLVDAVSRPYSIEGKAVHVSASIGVSFYPKNGTSSSVLMANADEALNLAKGQGKNQYQFAF